MKSGQPSNFFTIEEAHQETISHSSLAVRGIANLGSSLTKRVRLPFLGQLDTKKGRIWEKRLRRSCDSYLIYHNIYITIWNSLYAFNFRTSVLVFYTFMLFFNACISLISLKYHFNFEIYSCIQYLAFYICHLSCCKCWN